MCLDSTFPTALANHFTCASLKIVRRSPSLAKLLVTGSSNGAIDAARPTAVTRSPSPRAMAMA